MRNFGNVLVQPDDPAYLEAQIEPASELFAFGGLNVRSLRDEYRRQQRDFSTAPFDPDGRLLRFFPGGVTIWSGFPAAGKTTILRQLACHLMHRSQGLFIASFEESPIDVFMRHACTALGTENPSEDGLQWCLDSWSDHLRLWNNRWVDADAEYGRILAAIRVLARDGVRHAIIDSLMCLDVPSNDFEMQRQFAKALVSTAKSADVHIHLVAHPRKPFAPGQAPDINDVAGSADLGRRVDNVVFVRRSANERDAMPNQFCTPMLVTVCKQRFGTGALGEIHGWFHRGLRQFVSDRWQESPTQYLDSHAYEHHIAGTAGTEF
jgi:twinkle protein